MKDKIRKLLALAQDKGATEEEAASALRMASKLALKHGIEMTSLGSINQGPNIIRLNTKSYRSHPYIIHACQSAAKLYACQVVINHLDKTDNQFIICGLQENVDATLITFEWIHRQIERWYKHYLPKGMSVSERANYRRTFKYACSVRIHHRCMELVTELIEAPEKGMGTALVVQSYFKQQNQYTRAFMINEFPGLTRRKKSNRKTGRGTYDGMKAGDQVELHKQLD